MSVDRKRPGCIVFLLDQSSSMSGPMTGAENASKAVALAASVNQLLAAIVDRCRKERGEPPRDYFDIGVIGYNTGARSLFSGMLAGRMLVSVNELGRSRLRAERSLASYTRHIWFEPVADGLTHMCAALELATNIVQGWAASHQDSDQPIVINITDGYATDGDPEAVAARLTAQGTAVGGTLLFNFALGAQQTTPLSFPSSDAEVPDPKAKALFRMSSPLSPLMRQYAGEHGEMPASAARGFVFNADLNAVVKAMDIGTRIDGPRR
jgi:hypothetical protein